MEESGEVVCQMSYAIQFKCMVDFKDGRYCGFYVIKPIRRFLAWAAHTLVPACAE